MNQPTKHPGPIVFPLGVDVGVGHTSRKTYGVAIVTQILQCNGSPSQSGQYEITYSEFHTGRGLQREVNTFSSDHSAL